MSFNDASRLNVLGQATTGYNYAAGNYANFVDPTGLEGGPAGKSGRRNSSSS